MPPKEIKLKRMRGIGNPKLRPINPKFLKNPSNRRRLPQPCRSVSTARGPSVKESLLAQPTKPRTRRQLRTGLPHNRDLKAKRSGPPQRERKLAPGLEFLTLTRCSVATSRTLTAGQI